MRPRYVYQIAFLTSLFLWTACVQNHNRNEIGKDGLIAIESGHSKYSSEYQEAARMLADNNPKEAILIYKKLCKIEDEDKKTYCYMGLGTAFSRSNDYESAIKNYKLAIKYNNQNCESYVGLGSVYFKMQDYRNALLNYQIANKIDTTSSNSYWGLAITYDALGMTDSAKVNGAKYIRLEPNSNYKIYVENIMRK